MQISPVHRTRGDARKAYDHLSSFYDLLAGASEAPMRRMGLALLGIQPGEAVLEIGCGTGQSLVEIARLVRSSGMVHGLDLSMGMLAQAHGKLAKSVSYGNVHLVEGDGLHLPYPNGCFSAVFLSFTLELFDTPEIPQMLVECSRVLKLAGRLGVVALHKPMHPNPVVRLYEWLHARIPAYMDCRPINAAALIQSAGFTPAKQSLVSMWGLPVELVVAHKP